MSPNSLPFAAECHTDYVVTRLVVIACVPLHPPLSQRELSLIPTLSSYEPVWAIGTGLVATPKQAQDTHADIRSFLASRVSKKVADETRIIYGGSVSAKNARELGESSSFDSYLPIGRGAIAYRR